MIHTKCNAVEEWECKNQTPRVWHSSKNVNCIKHSLDDMLFGEAKPFILAAVENGVKRTVRDTFSSHNGVFASIGAQRKHWNLINSVNECQGFAVLLENTLAPLKLELFREFVNCCLKLEFLRQNYSVFFFYYSSNSDRIIRTLLHFWLSLFRHPNYWLNQYLKGYFIRNFLEKMNQGLKQREHLWVYL